MTSLPSPSSSVVVSDTLRSAKDRMEQGQFSEALTLYRSVLEQDGENPVALEGMGLALLEMGDIKNALPNLQKATQKDNKRVAAQTALAEMAYTQGLLAEARLRLRAALDTEARNADLWHTLGIVIRDEQGDTAAVLALGNAVRYAPTNIAYRMDYADALLIANKFDLAEREYRTVYNAEPTSAEVRARFGAFLVQLPVNPARLTEAKPLLEAVVATDAQDLYARYYLGRLILEQGDIPKAIALMEPVVQGPPSAEMREVWYTLSRAYARAGRKEDAKRAATTSRRLTVEHDRFTHAQEQVARNPNDVEALLTLARIFAERGDYAKALAEYDSILRRKPDHPKARPEKVALEKRLQAAGKMPDMTLFNAVLSANQ